MKSVKYIIIVCFFFSACTSVEKIKNKPIMTSEKLKFEEVYLSNPNLFYALDTIMLYSQEFRCFNSDNSYYSIKFFIENDTISLTIYLKNFTWINYALSGLNEEKSRDGFYYNNKFFWVDYGAEIGYKYDLIRKSNKDFIFQYSYEIQKKKKREKKYNELGLEYLYLNDKFIINRIWECDRNKE